MIADGRVTEERTCMTTGMEVTNLMPELWPCSI